MKYNYLLLDIDGTLIGTKYSTIGHDPGLKSFLDAYMKSDGKIGLITGRSENDSAILYEFLGLNGVMIVEMGAGIVFPNKERLALTSLDNSERVREFLKEKGLLKIMLEEPKSFMISLRLPEFPHHNPKRLIEIYNGVRHEFETTFSNVEVTVDDYSIDFYNPKSDKGEAIKTYAERERVNLENIVTVGDSRSDYPAFRAIGNKGLVAYVGLDDQFAEELKKEFPGCYLTRDKRSSGVVEVISHLLRLH